MKNGTVKFYKQDRGFGFITNDDSGEDIFVHATGLEVDSIKEGSRVSYEVKEGKRGLQAVNVRLS